MSFLWRVGMFFDSVAMTIDCAIDSVKDTCDDLKDFAKDTADDFKELGEIVVEGTVDLTQTAVDGYLDYTSERVDRFFENWDAILSDSPYLDGKKQGYEEASYIFDELYAKQNEENEKLLQILKENHSSSKFKVEYIQKLLADKKEELNALRNQKQINLENAAKASGYTKSQILGFVSNTRCMSLFDLICNKKLMEKKKGEVAGFNEAKALFQHRLEEMKTKYNKAIDELIVLAEGEVALYKEICDEIAKEKECIAAIEIFVR